MGAGLREPMGKGKKPRGMRLPSSGTTASEQLKSRWDESCLLDLQEKRSKGQKRRKQKGINSLFFPPQPFIYMAEGGKKSRFITVTMEKQAVPFSYFRWDWLVPCFEFVHLLWYKLCLYWPSFTQTSVDPPKHVLFLVFLCSRCEYSNMRFSLCFFVHGLSA